MKRSIFMLGIFLSACLIAANPNQAPAVAGVVYMQDYASLQAAIDATPNGGTVVMPAGVFEIGDVVIASEDVWQKVVTLQGAAPGHLGQAPGQGSAQWDMLIDGGYTYGTFLRGTITVALGEFSGATTAKAYFRDFALVGYGEGIGIDYGDGINMYPEGAIESVSIGNFDTGIRVRKSYYMSITDVSMAGVGTGLLVQRSNVITVSGLNIASCGTGVQNDGASNTFLGGSVQGCENGVVLGGFSNVLGGFYFENISGASVSVTGRGNTVLANYYTDGDLLVSGHNNRFFTSETSEPVQVTGDFNRVDLSAYGTCNDSGFANECIRLYPVK